MRLAPGGAAGLGAEDFARGAVADGQRAAAVVVQAVRADFAAVLAEDDVGGGRGGEDEGGVGCEGRGSEDAAAGGGDGAD